MATGSSSSGVHCRDACPPSPNVVTIKSCLPNLRFMGAGTLSILQPLKGIIETPAVVAAETLMKFLLEIRFFLLNVITSGFFHKVTKKQLVSSIHLPELIPYCRDQ